MPKSTASKTTRTSKTTKASKTTARKGATMPKAAPSKPAPKFEKKDVYQVVTDKILAMMEQGDVAWEKPWFAVGAPMNIERKKPYQGVNVFLLGAEGRQSPWWGTIDQWNAKGAYIKKGEKSSMVVFYKPLVVDKEGKDGSTVKATIPLLRYSNVFNAEQVDIDPAKLPAVGGPAGAEELPALEEVGLAMEKPVKIIVKGSDRAFYQPGADVITLPAKKQFKTTEGFYSTKFHEMVHSTGHSSRLDRDTLNQAGRFGDENYSREELVAELGAAMLCNMSGIETDKTLRNSATYIKGWSKALREDKKLFVKAAGQATKAVNYILGIKTTKAADEKDAEEISGK